ncbi:MAG: IS630 family transposase, partial [Actinomycetota bacterium]
MRRAQIVLMSAQREAATLIARALRSTPEHVREVIHAFNDGGMKALKPRWRLQGPEPTFDETSRARIVEIACARPREIGAPFTEWSLSKLQAYLMEEGVVSEISLESIRRILAEEQISYQRLKTWKQSPDPDYEAKKNRVLRTRRMARHGIPVVALDEFGPLSLRPWPGQGWYRQRTPRRRRATFKRDKGIRYFMGGYDLTRDELFGDLVASKNRFAFIDLLRATRRRFPRAKRIYVI